MVLFLAWQSTVVPVCRPPAVRQRRSFGLSDLMAYATSVIWPILDLFVVLQLWCVKGFTAHG